MSGISQVVTLDQDGCLHLRINRAPGSRIRVIVEDVDGGADEAIEVTNLSGPVSAASLGQTAFVRDVLANAAEDAWNDV
jgi:hypothetical protein